MSNLTPEEQAEMNQLEAEEKGGWSAAEDAELAALEKEFGGEKAEEPSMLSKLNPFKGATVGENLSAAAKTLESMTPDLSTFIPNSIHSLPDFLTSQAENAPLVGPASKYVGGKVDAAFGGSEEGFKQKLLDDEAIRNQRSPVAAPSGSASLALANPLNRMAGALPAVANLGVSMADSGTRKLGNDEKINSLIDTGSDGGNFAENTLIEGVTSLFPSLAALRKSGKLDDLAVNQVKNGFGATTTQMAEFGIKGDQMDNAAKKMLEMGLYDKPLQSKEGLYNALRDKMTAKGQQMDVLADEYGQGVKRGDLADMLAVKGGDARKIGQADLESAYKAKGNAFLSPETVQAQKDIRKIDKALGKPQLDYDKVGDQQASLGRKAGIADIKQELLNNADLDEEDLVRQLRQAQIDDQLSSIDERGGYIGAKQAFNEEQTQGLRDTRSKLQQEVEAGRDDLLSTADLRTARRKEDARAYPSQMSVDPDKAEIAGTLRQAEMDSLPEGPAKDLYADHKKDYATLAPAEQMTLKAAARDETKGLLNLQSNQKGRLVGGTAGFAIAGPTGAVVGQQLGAMGESLVRKYGSQLGAYGFNKASKVLQNEGWAKTLVDAGERGGAAGIGTAHFLLTQRDPAYRKAHQEDQEAERNK